MRRMPMARLKVSVMPNDHGVHPRHGGITDTFTDALVMP